MDARQVKSISLVPLTPLGKGPTAEPPLLAPAIAATLDAICGAEDLCGLEAAAVERLAPLAGAHTALIRPCGRQVRLSPELAAFEGRLEGLARRALRGGGFAWERQGDQYMAVFPLWAQGEPVGELMLAGDAGRVLQLVGASAPLLVLCGPLALALAVAVAGPRRATSAWHVVPDASATPILEF